MRQLADGGREKTIFLILRLLAIARGALAPSPSTPSAVIPPYEKASGKKRGKKKPGRKKKGHAGARREREGRYILKTDVSEITALDAVEAYKELSVVESGFRDLKDVLAMRPVWHKTDDRVRAHIFVATLGLFLKRALQHHLDSHQVNLTATEALESLRSVGLSELDLDGARHRVVSAPGRDARRVFSALGITSLHPPGGSGA